MPTRLKYVDYMIRTYLKILTFEFPEPGLDIAALYHF